MLEPLVASGGTAGPAAAPGGGLGGLSGIRPGGSPGGIGAAPVQQNVGNSKANEIEANPQDVTLEVCGLVQIYNPPDEAKLGTGSASDPGKRPNGVPTAVVRAPRGGSGATGGIGGGGLSGMRGN